MSNDKVMTAGTVEVMLFHGKRKMDRGLLQEPLQVFVYDVTRIAQAEGHILEGITMFFADAQPARHSKLGMASVDGNRDLSESDLAEEARLARARKLLGNI